MAVQVRTLDDGAWVSVNNSRVVGAGDLWELGDHEVCACPTADFLVEAFANVGVVGRRIEVRAAGKCIGCGREAVTDWLPVGRVTAGRFRPSASDSVRAVPDR